MGKSEDNQRYYNKHKKKRNVVAKSTPYTGQVIWTPRQWIEGPEDMAETLKILGKQKAN